MKVMPDSEIVQKTYIALKHLVDNSWYMQRKAYNAGAHRHCGSFLNEFCTVKLCTARQSGHSRAIARLCCEYFHKAIIVVPTEKMMERLIPLFRPYVEHVTKQTRTYIGLKNGESEYHFCTNADQMRGIEAEAIFVDCASFVSSAKREEVEAVAKGRLNPPDPFFLIYVE